MKMQGIHYDLDSLFPREPDFYEEEEFCLKDYEYLKRMYPKEERLIATVLEEYMDRYEYEGSPMYAEYPDAVTIFRMANEIFQMLSFEASEKEKTQMKNMIQLMVCNEMYIRRRRHDKFCRRFSASCRGMRYS